MGNIIKLKSGEIENSLKGVTRQYLVGNLKKAQALRFIKDEKLEIGITDYKEYTTEVVHYHTEAVEYQYVISGKTKYMDVENNTVYEFSAGDFYCIETHTTYAQKSDAGTRILFIKVPSINDKKVVEISAEVQGWYDEGM